MEIALAVSATLITLAALFGLVCMVMMACDRDDNVIFRALAVMAAIMLLIGFPVGIITLLIEIWSEVL